MTDKKPITTKGIPKKPSKAWHFPIENKTVFATSFDEAKKKLQIILKT